MNTQWASVRETDFVIIIIFLDVNLIERISNNTNPYNSQDFAIRLGSGWANYTKPDLDAN